jgi:hypothetical protein
MAMSEVRCRRRSLFVGVLLTCLLFAACGGGGGGDGGGIAAVNPNNAILINSLDDVASPPAGTMTFRSAFNSLASGGTITFAPSLNGKTINLTLVGSAHSILKGEVYNPDQTYAGFQERDYGPSALYARKDITIDASSLPDGITINWAGGDANRARVIAVYGNLTLRNVTITSGYASSVVMEGGTQPYTLARGGGIAVWGTATLERCTLAGNRASGDVNASRDRGAFGGGIYGDRLVLTDSIISGNSVIGYGAAGGGVYSVGGIEASGNSSLTRCTITGNRITAQHTYGGGVFSEGGGRGGAKSIDLRNCTIARNRVMDHPDIAEAPSGYYYRGGGVYMSNGWFTIVSCTIVENAVTGNPAVFSNKPNMGGGGVAATIGDAHVVERMRIGHSIIAGNTVNGVSNDVYTGSLLYFDSYGYNLIGTIDFSQILVPVPPWWSLSRKHWPKAGDHEGVALADVVALGSIERHGSILSVGTDSGEKAVLWYPPAGIALDQVPAAMYTVYTVLAQYSRVGGTDGAFLNGVLQKVRNDYGLGDTFGQDLIYDVHDFVADPVTWPRSTDNAGWIQFWRDLDTKLPNSLGAVKLGDEFWNSFAPGPFGPNVTMEISSEALSVLPLADDQRGIRRPAGPKGDIGAIEAVAE